MDKAYDDFKKNINLKVNVPQNNTWCATTKQRNNRNQSNKARLIALYNSFLKETKMKSATCGDSEILVFFRNKFKKPDF